MRQRALCPAAGCQWWLATVPGLPLVCGHFLALEFGVLEPLSQTLNPKNYVFLGGRQLVDGALAEDGLPQPAWPAKLVRSPLRRSILLWYLLHCTTEMQPQLRDTGAWIRRP